MSHSVKSPKRKRSPSPPSRKKVRMDGPGTDTPSTPKTEAEPTSDDGSDVYAEFLRAINGDDPVSPTKPLVGTPTVPQSVVTPSTQPTVGTGPKPANPLAGKVKKLRGNFGTGYHDTAHFKATDRKAHHGVWQGSIPTVKEWVQLALDSIKGNDQFVVASKKGANGGWNYLVSMDGATVGYLSGSAVKSGTKPPAQYIEVYLDKKGNAVSAFPSSPDIF